MLRISDISPFLQLAWKKSSYSTFYLIYSRFLLFLHKVPSIIVALYFYLSTLDSIWLIEDFHDVKSKFRTWGWGDDWLAYLTAFHESPSILEFLFPNDGFHLLWIDLLCHSPCTLCWWGLRHPTSPRDMFLSRWLVLALLFSILWSTRN